MKQKEGKRQKNINKKSLSFVSSLKCLFTYLDEEAGADFSRALIKIIHNDLDFRVGKWFSLSSREF